VPAAPLKPVLVDQQPSFIEFNWTAPYDGHDPILDYRVLWDKGLNGALFFELTASTFNTLSHKTQTVLTSGTYYQFKVIAVNSIGDSAPSESVSIIAATIPDAPNKPTLVFQDESTIEVTWTSNFNGGTPIDDY